MDLHHYNSNMLKKILAIWGMALLLIVLPLIGTVHAAPGLPAPEKSSAAELIDQVNALRASRGLPPYQTNSILMGIAQSQAEYLVSIGTVSHTGPDGSRPFQRALAAGYLLAGDLTKGGFFSENITAGVGQTAEEAVNAWMGDEPHMTTMLSSTLQDVGAGVGTYGNTYYYVLDCGLSTGGKPVSYTPGPNIIENTPTIIPNTPNADGSIIHIVQTGDTLGSLSMAYNVPLADLLKLNNFTLKSIIYVNQKIIIRLANTPTPTLPTGTPTIPPTITEWPTSSPISTETPLPPTQTASPVLPVASARGTLSIIVIAAVLVAAGITIFGVRKKK